MAERLYVYASTRGPGRCPRCDAFVTRAREIGTDRLITFSGAPEILGTDRLVSDGMTVVEIFSAGAVHGRTCGAGNPPRRREWPPTAASSKGRRRP